MSARRSFQFLQHLSQSHVKPFSTKSMSSTFVFRQLFDAESSTYTYLLAEGRGKPGILIDPVLEQVDRDLKLIKELQIDLQYAINTHCHADHITGTGRIKKLLPGVKSIISEASTAKADILLKPNDFINGRIDLNSGNHENQGTSNTRPHQRVHVILLGGTITCIYRRCPLDSRMWANRLSRWRFRYAV